MLFSVLQGKGQFNRGDVLQLARRQAGKNFAYHQSAVGDVDHRQVAVDAGDAGDAGQRIAALFNDFAFAFLVRCSVITYT